ncbi:MAG TPA: OmpA family protein, partial [Pirellulaceae bacterium]|nr:OmpA family protein [Pirellulaceae bacterium]
MMAFFLVMWIVAQSEQMKEAIAHHFNDPFAKESDEDGTVHQRPPKHPAPARITDRPEHEKEAGGSHSVLLTTQGGERTSIGTVLHFTDDSAELDGEAQRRLAEIAPLLVGKPQKIEVRGHSSRRPLNTGSPFSDHWHLSYQRCLAVMAELEKLQIPHERLRLSQAAGYEPLAAPDEQFPGGGYARVEVCLLNETTGAKVAQHGGTTKARVKVTETHHAPQHGPPKPPLSQGEKSSAPSAPNAGKPAAEGHTGAAAASKGH